MKENTFLALLVGIFGLPMALLALVLGYEVKIKCRKA